MPKNSNPIVWISRAKKLIFFIFKLYTLQALKNKLNYYICYLASFFN
ncbi:hypothetical protein FTH_1653 [Francisella tularensis subsp. holarctica OSU18]|nr:hypothetical protein FTH_1653 [Francisella tularensis subsp. holarctica OSU18]